MGAAGAKPDGPGGHCAGSRRCVDDRALAESARRGALSECVRGGPASEQAQGFFGRRAGLGAEGDHGQARVGRELHRLEGEGEVADDRMAEMLDAGVERAYGVRSPPATERFAERGELADEAGDEFPKWAESLCI
jgi:hypothetical protein